MNRLTIFTLLVLMMPIALFAQINWTEHFITGYFPEVHSVYAIDINGDSAVDVLVASEELNDILWWENDGKGHFTTKHYIDNESQDACDVYAIDLDGDGDVDVLSGAYAQQIVWYENDDGVGSTWSKHTVGEPPFWDPTAVYAEDVNGDDYMDVLGVSDYGWITWWENINGTGNSWTEHSIDTSSYDFAKSVYGTDLDDDGDVDVLVAADDNITWFENEDSNGTFWIEHTVDSNFNGAHSVFVADVDGDLNIDILGAAIAADDITWWENDGTANSWTKHVVDSNFNGARSVYGIDLDNDGDVDILGAAYNADDITWWENEDSFGTTWIKHTIAGNFDGAYDVYAIDLDDDSDIDVLGVAHIVDDVSWWQSDLLVLEDVSTTSIDIPSAFPADTTFNPRATITNLGAGISSFDVTCEITPGAYSSTETVANLAPDDGIQVTFSNAFTPVPGWYTVEVYTKLTNDINPTNDTLDKVVEAIRIDVGPVSIDMPATVPEDTMLHPQATVKNFGTHSETFIVTCEITPGNYSSTQGINDLASDSCKQVTFADSFHFVSGTYTVTVYTRCPFNDDENPANDTLEKVIQTTGIAEDGSVKPTSFSFGLKSNPIRSKAIFNLSLPRNASVTLDIYDVSGRHVATPANGMKPAGNHTITWAPKTNAGVYFYTFKSPWGNKTGKILFVR